MPIYEFECPACSERFDRLQKLSDPDPDACPNCGAAGVRRRLTAPSFRLAGSGWYETDFKKGAEKKRNLAESGGTSGSEAAAKEPSKGDAKSESGKQGAAAGAASRSAEPAKPAPADKPAGKPASGKPAD